MTRILRHISLLGAAEILARFLGVALSIYLARTLGPAMFGVWSFVLAVYAYFALVVANGTETIALREIVRRDLSVSQVTTSLFLLRSLLTIGAGLAFAVIWRLRILPEIVVGTLGVQLISLTLFGWSLQYYFQAVRRSAVIVLAKTLSGALFLLCAFWLVRSPEDVVWVPAASVVGAAISQLVVLGIFKHSGERFIERITSAVVRKMFIWSLPLGMTGLLLAVMEYADTLILGLTRTPAEVALYAAAGKTIFVFAAAQGVFGQVLLSYRSESYKEGKSEADLTRPVSELLHRAFLFASVGGAICLAALSPWLCAIMFGPEYAEAVPLMEILAFAGGCVAASAIPISALVAGSRQRTYLGVMAVGAAFNLFMNILLVPRIGTIAAACVSLATHLLTCSALMAASRRVVNITRTALLQAGMLMLAGGLCISLGWPLAALLPGTGSVAYALRILSKRAAW